MYRCCTTKETVRRQRQIEQCLLRAMEKRRYEDISVRELCRDAEISRMAFYQYFENKDDALLALVDHTLQDLGFSDSTDCELKQFASHWMHQKSLLDALHNNKLDNLLAERALHLVLSEDYDFRRLLGVEANETGKLVLRFAVQGIISVIQAWHQSQFRLSPEEIESLLRRILLQPLMIAQNN